MSDHSPRYVRLARDGVAVLLEQPGDGLPIVLYWGADPGSLSDQEFEALAIALSRQTEPGALDAAWQLSLLPQESDGWVGRPGALLSRGPEPVFPRWNVIGMTADEHSITYSSTSPGIALRSTITVESGGVVTVLHELENTGDAELDVHWIEATLPVPKSADYLTTFSGRWTREKAPHTAGMPRGSIARQIRRGRPGHDNPNLFIASMDEPRNRSGELWAAHVGWSADTTWRTDRFPEAVQILGGGELLRPGEVRLAAGDSYRTPVTYFVHSDAGLDGVSARFHSFLRSRPQHPRTPRPLVLNTWEAVYFDHDPERVLLLAERAAKVGVERFVLDDGWFLGRRDDTTSLGDWVVDRTVWLEGLAPLADRVHELGMQFGLWFEPEMVSLDSELARAHPDWLLHNAGHLDAPDRLSWRTQYVLDLANPGAFEHVRGQISVLVDELGIDFIKWDHNRDLVEPIHDGRPGTHEQTLATYRLLADLKGRHPGLEIESCSSGGARTDLGILEFTDRVWASDSNDPVERQDIQRWTGLILPPELVGGHVGPPRAHSSGRTTDLSFRLATTLLGSAGFEWNVLECGDKELAAITRFAELYKQLRPIIHSGTAVHPDVADPALRVAGFVSPNGSAAVFTVATVAALEDSRPAPLRLPGLDPERRYRVRVVNEFGESRHGSITPGWMSEGGIVLSGSMLGTAGLQLPGLWPMQAIVLHVVGL